MVIKIYLWWSIVRLFQSRFLINVAPPPFSGQDSFFSFFSSLLSAPRRFSIHPRFVVLASAGRGRDEERRRSKLGIDRLLIGFIGAIIWEVFNGFFGCAQHYIFCLISATHRSPNWPRVTISFLRPPLAPPISFAPKKKCKQNPWSPILGP